MSWSFPIDLGRRTGWGTTGTVTLLPFGGVPGRGRRRHTVRRTGPYCPYSVRHDSGVKTSTPIVPRQRLDSSVLVLSLGPNDRGLGFEKGILTVLLVSHLSPEPQGTWDVES